MSSRPPSKIVFVGNIPYGLSEEQISDIFSSAGRVVNFRLVYDRENGKPKGFGFAEYPDSDSAASAVRNLNDYEVMGRKLRVDFSNEGGSGEDDHRPSNGDYSTSAAAPTAASSASLPILPPGKDIPPGASATDEISRVLRTLPPTQLLDVLTQMKTLASHDPARATELLVQAPQLAYAVFQALLLMDLVSPEAMQSVLEGGGHQTLPVGGPGGGGLSAAAGGGAGYAPPPAVAATGYGGGGAPPNVGGGYAPAPALAPAAAPAEAAPQNTDDLIQQVLALPQEVIDQLPEAERTQLMTLRAQYGR